MAEWPGETQKETWTRRIATAPPASAKEIADELLHDICLIDEMWHWRADIWYDGADHLASAAADPKNKKTVYLVGF